jgi:oligopeptide/dipeptide ABC transporter ATP-binding protein
MNEPLLELRSVTTWLEVDAKLYPAIRDVDLTVERGEVLGLVGESGSGKSITARTIVRLLPNAARTDGEIMFDGEDILRLDGKALRALRASRISFIVQDPRSGSNPLRRCGDAVVEVLRVNTGQAQRDARRNALRLFEEVGLRDPQQVMRSYPHEVSGGMLQRVLIAAAIAAEPELLIADEPTTALDVTTQAGIVKLFDELRRSRGLTLLFITHDLELAATVCDRVAVMYGGRIVEVQPVERLFSLPYHPYTSALLSSRPPLSGPIADLRAIPGRPPPITEVIPGCPFHVRCAYAAERCRREVPTLADAAAGPAGVVACWRAGEKEGHSDCTTIEQARHV